MVVVEDDQSSLELLQVYLEDGGLRLESRTGWRDRLGHVRRERPDAVVLDIRLPGLVGWDMLAALKADTATSAIPVVVASVVDERARGLSLGATAYLVKPIQARRTGPMR